MSVFGNLFLSGTSMAPTVFLHALLIIAQKESQWGMVLVVLAGFMVLGNLLFFWFVRRTLERLTRTRSLCSSCA